jgi:transcriptional regulator with XRE-family HTH domain
MTDPQILGALLRRYRESAGLKQAEVAAHIRRDRSTYAGYENGHSLPGREALVALADLFKISLDLLASADGGGTDAASQAQTEAEALVLHCFRRLPSDEAKAYLDLLLARVRNPGN